MVDKIDIEINSGGFKRVPMCQFELNRKQQFIAIAIDRKEEKFEIEPRPGLSYDWMGKLSEQNVVFEAEVINSLRREAWDFDTYPDPEIILITILM